MMKTTCRFMKNNGLFSVNVRRLKTINEPPIKNRVFRSVKIPIITPSRAHAYARITGVFAFLLSQVSHPNHNILYLRLLHITWTYFNKQTIIHLNTNENISKNLNFLSTFSTISRYNFPHL